MSYYRAVFRWYSCLTFTSQTKTCSAHVRKLYLCSLELWPSSHRGYRKLAIFCAICGQMWLWCGKNAVTVISVKLHGLACHCIASATGLEGKGEKEACHNLFSHARTFPEFWEFCMYVNKFTVYFMIKYPTFPRGQKQVVAGLLSFPLEACGGG